MFGAGVLVILCVLASAAAGLTVTTGDNGETFVKVGFIGANSRVSGEEPLYAVKAAIANVNADPDLLPGITLTLVTNLTSDSSEATRAFQRFVEEEGIAFNIGPSFSSISQVVGVAALSLRTLTMSHTATSTALSIPIFENFFRSIPDDKMQCDALASLAGRFDWNDVSIVVGTDSFSQGLANCLLTRFDSAKVRVLNFEVFRLQQSDGLTNNTFSNLRGTGVRVVYMLAQSDEIGQFIKFASLPEYEFVGSPYVYLFPETGIAAQRSEAGVFSKVVAKGLVGSFSTTQGRGDPNHPALAQIREAVIKGRGEPPLATVYYLYAYDALIAYAHGLQKLLDDGKSLAEATHVDLREALFSINVPDGVTGRISFDRLGNRVGGSFDVFNYRNAKDESYFWAKYVDEKVEDKADPVFPDGTKNTPDSTPSLSKEVYSCDEKTTFFDNKGVITFDSLDSDPNYIKVDLHCDGVVDCKNWSDEGFSCEPSLAVAMSVFGGIAVLFALIILAGVMFMTVHSDHRVMKAMGSLYLYTFSFFSAVGCLAVVLIFGQATDVTCQLRIWVLAICSAITIGTMSAKQYRVLRIFNNRTMKPVSVTNQQLVPIIGGICVPDLLVLAIWTGLFTYKAEVDGDHLTCSSTFDLGFLLIMFAYKGILLLVLSVMAFCTRHYPSKYSESTQLAIAIYNTTLIGLILVPVILAISVEWLQFLFACIFILAVFFVPWIIICVPKIYLVISKGDSDISSQSAGSSTGRRPAGGSVTVDWVST